MNCADIAKALIGDNPDLTEIRRHLDRCFECNSLFGQDLELEQSLSRLANDIIPQDITAEVRDMLNFKVKRRRKFNFIRSRLKAAAAMLALITVLVMLPRIIGWLIGFYNAAFSMLGNISRMVNPEMTSLYATISNSEYSLYIIYFLIMALGVIGSYLYREFRTVLE